MNKMYEIRRNYPAFDCYACEDIPKDTGIEIGYTKISNDKDFFKAYKLSKLAACNDYRGNNLRLEKIDGTDSYIFITNKNIKNGEKLSCSYKYYTDLFGNNYDYFSESLIMDVDDGDKSLISFSDSGITALEDIIYVGNGVNIGIAFEKRLNWIIFPGWENIRHSDDPNCKVIRERWDNNRTNSDHHEDYSSYHIYTIRDIKKSEIITIDFDTLPENLATILAHSREVDIRDDEIVGNDDDNSMSNTDADISKITENNTVVTTHGVFAKQDIEYSDNGVSLGITFNKNNINSNLKNISHSNNPNAKIIKTIVSFNSDGISGDEPNESREYYTLVNNRNIKQGESITVDYNDIPNEIKDIISSKNSVIDNLNENNKLKTKERNILPDKLFGLPKERKYPLHDEAHVRKAIQFFTYCPEEDKPELAKNIQKRMKQLKMNINIGEKNPLSNYINEYSIEELSKYIKNNLTPNEIEEWNKYTQNINLGINIWNMIHNGYRVKDIEEICIKEVQEIDLTNINIIKEGGGVVFVPDGVIAEFDIPYDGQGINLHIAFEKKKNWKIRKGWDKVKHSDDPNCRIIKQEWLDNPQDKNKCISYFIITCKDIKKGEQITINYSDLPIEIREKLINKNFKELDFVDIFNIEHSSTNESYIEEYTRKDDEIVPVYVILTSTGSKMAKLIQKVTKTVYNHASLAFDADLSRMYSFGSGDDDKLGFALESKDNTFLRKFKDVKCQVYAVFVRKDQADKMKRKLDEFILMKDKFKYNFLGLIGYLMKKPIKNNFAMFCSEFVDSMFKLVDIDLTHKDSSLVEPFDFARSGSKKIYKVYEGFMHSYEESKINKLIQNLKKKYKPIAENYIIDESYIEESFKFWKKDKDGNIINEVKELPVQFDKDGNLLIKNFRKLDYEHEYAKSHKLLVAYEDNNNYEGMKYELCKLWFMNSLLEKSIYDNKTNIDKRKEYIKVRARILNDFNKYLKIITKNDKLFNFTQYFDNTPFSDAILRINKDTITGVGKIIKKLIV